MKNVWAMIKRPKPPVVVDLEADQYTVRGSDALATQTARCLRFLAERIELGAPIEVTETITGIHLGRVELEVRVIIPKSEAEKWPTIPF